MLGAIYKLLSKKNMDPSTNESNEATTTVVTEENKTGSDPKNRTVTLTISETEIVVEKEGVERHTKSCATFAEAIEHFDFLILDSQN
jgi:hypothetical protein